MSNPIITSPRVGRYYVIAAVTLLVATDIAITAAYVARLGADRLPQQVVRLALLLGLGYALLHRQRWARWVIVVLLFMGCWVLTRRLPAQGAFNRDEVWRTLPFLALFVGYGVIIRSMIYSASVRAFFIKPEPSDPAPLATSAIV